MEDGSCIHNPNRMQITIVINSVGTRW